MTQSPLSRLNLSKQRLEELRDASLTRLYEAGATTLSSAADWLDKTPLAKKVPFAKESAGQLRETAKAAEQAGKAVNLPPIADYDELNVKQVNEALEGLTAYELEKVRAYETAHKNRVTVLREVERRLD